MDLEVPEGDMEPAPAASPHPDNHSHPHPGHGQQPVVASITRPRSRRGGPGSAPKGSGASHRLVPPQDVSGVTAQVTSCMCCRQAPAQTSIVRTKHYTVFFAYSLMQILITVHKQKLECIAVPSCFLPHTQLDAG